MKKFGASFIINKGINQSMLNKFIDVNSKIWNQSYSTNKFYTFIDGMIDEELSYIFKGALASKSIEEQSDCKNMVILNRNIKYINKIYDSFKIDRIILSNFIIKNFYLFIDSLLATVKLFLDNKSSEELLKFKYKSIKIGDLIYDDILRFENSRKPYKFRNLYTFSKLSFKRDFLRVWFCISIVDISLYICDHYNIKYYLSSHINYRYGIYVRTFLKHNVTVINFNPEFKLSAENLKPTLHDEYRKIITNSLNSNTSRYINLGLKHLKDRFKGKDNLDSCKSAFSTSKKILKVNEFKELFKIKNNNKNVFILSHIFADIPHAASNTLYKDYFTWLDNTLKYVSSIKTSNWFVKIHPDSDKYEKEKIKSLVIKYNTGNIFLVPDIINSATLLYNADTIITVCGTAGIEFSCKGIPVIVTGSPFYSKFGFTIEPHTIKEYKKVLRNINNIKPLCDSQINLAYEILGIYIEKLYCTEINDFFCQSIDNNKNDGGLRKIIKYINNNNVKENAVYTNIKNMI